MSKPAATTVLERRQELLHLLRAFMDFRPLDPSLKKDGALYLPFHEQPGLPRGPDPIEQLRLSIEAAPEASTCQLFSGFQGSGKSTELHRLKAELQKAGFPVIFVAGGEFIHLNKPLEPTDLLLSVAAAVALDVEKSPKHGKNPAKKTLFEALTEFFGRIRLKEIEIGLGVDLGLGKGATAKATLGKLKAELAENPSFKQRVQDTLRGSFRQFLDAFRCLMDEVRKMLSVAKGGKSPVLIVDDLEKVQGLATDQDMVQKSVEQVFWSFHYALRIADWHCVWAAPPYLQLLNSNFESQYDGGVVLPMVRLWSNDAVRTPDEHGMTAMKKCLRLRGDKAKVSIDSLFFDESLLDRVVTTSSGHFRELFRLMQALVREAHRRNDDRLRREGPEAPYAPLNETAIDTIIENFVLGSQRAVYGNDHPWLRAVATRRNISLASEQLIPRVAKLMDTAAVMTYQNGTRWLDVSVPVQKLLEATPPAAEETVD